MEYMTLGQNGVRVSQLCLGTWRFGKESDGELEVDREETHEILDAAWDAGINFIDTANVYGTPTGRTESYLGDWLDDHDREDFVISSKVFGVVGDGPNDRGLGRKHIRSQINATLDRLNTDYLDVYYIHDWDPATTIAETLATLNDLVREGKVHYIGASDMAAWQLVKSLWVSDIHDWESFTVTQPKFNAAYREEKSDYYDVCVDQDLPVCAYSPLEGGFLTNKYSREGDVPEDSRAKLDDDYDPTRYSNQKWAVLDAIVEVANELNATPAQVSLRWLIEYERFPTIPVVGASKIEQLEENIGAVDISLSDAQRKRINTAYDLTAE